jgi:hypothetical protein
MEYVPNGKLFAGIVTVATPLIRLVGGARLVFRDRVTEPVGNGRPASGVGVIVT